MPTLGSEIRWTDAPVSEDAPPPASVVVLTTAELAECSCPEFCERDHDVD
jgi:hypothetical protein